LQNERCILNSIVKGTLNVNADALSRIQLDRSNKIYNNHMELSNHRNVGKEKKWTNMLSI